MQITPEEKQWLGFLWSFLVPVIEKWLGQTATPVVPTSSPPVTPPQQ